MGVDVAVGVAAHEAVLAGNRNREPRKQPIGIGQRTTGDERQRARECLGQRRQQLRDGGAHAHAIGRRGELQQRSVDVEKHGRLGGDE